jgi:S1-C subfamily serine protease
VLGGALVGGALVSAGWVANDLSGSETAVETALPAESVGEAATTPVAPLDTEEPVAAVAAALAPSVVQIEAGEGLGSGVVYDESGLILTNAHVVGSSSSVDVVLSDGTTIGGTVLGSDDLTDIAVVQVDAGNDLTVARLADDLPRVGQVAVALGSPFGLEQSVTSGVVSAVERPVSNPQGAVVAMIQADAAINPGNSGGPLADRAGQVIGINTLIFSESGGNDGIGFAIPIRTALDVAGRIVSGDPLERGFLGVTTQEDPNEPGAIVASVEPGSAAADAGLRRGDVIVEIDGAEVRGPSGVAARIQAAQPGDTVSIVVNRDGGVVELTATLGRIGN